MGTYASVSLRVKPEYKGPRYFKLPSKEDKSHEIIINSEYLTTFISHDGYLNGVGLGLHKELGYDDYDKIFTYVLLGLRTSFDEPYYERSGETWEENKPFASTMEEILNSDNEDYQYLYDEFDGKWEWRWKENNDTKEWLPLRCMFKDIE